MFESKLFRICFAATLVIFAICCGEVLSAQEKERVLAGSKQPYRIAIGDQIRVEVWKHPELSRTVVVDRKGKITLPVLREVKVTGLSTTDVFNVVRHKLQSVVPNAQVTVVIGRGRFSPLQKGEPGDAVPSECCIAKAG